MIFFYLKLLIILNLSCSSFAKGDLTKQDAITVEVLLKGNSGYFHNYTPSTLIFETGKLYKLKIQNVSDSKHYFSSKKFAESIFTRKIEINKDGRKIGEVKGMIKELEIYPNNTLEWWFVPIQIGSFDDLFCRILDKETNKSHAEMGMKGKIIIE